MLTRFIAAVALAVLPVLGHAATVSYNAATDELTVQLGTPTIANGGQIDPSAFNFGAGAGFGAGTAVEAVIMFTDTSITGTLNGAGTRRNYLNGAADIMLRAANGDEFSFSTDGNNTSGVRVQVRDGQLRIGIRGRADEPDETELRIQRGFRWDWTGLSVGAGDTLEELLISLTTNAAGSITGSTNNVRLGQFDSVNGAGNPPTSDVLSFDETPTPPVVPLPAGGMLLVTAAGAFVLVRRRRKSAG